MPVQMIELEEVQMVEIIDEALEATAKVEECTLPVQTIPC